MFLITTVKTRDSLENPHFITQKSLSGSPERLLI
jgi:hypothetical protein